MSNPLYDTLFGANQGRDAPFLFLPDGSVLSYKDFLSMAARYANTFAGLGLEPGDRVAVQVGKSPEALAVYAACAQAGLVFLPLNTAYTVSEIDYFITNSTASVFLCDGAGQDALQPMCQDAGTQLFTLNGDGSGTFADRAKTQSDSFDTVAREGGDLAALLYTSGTTGRSKGAMLTQGNLLSNARTLVECWRFSDQDVLLHALPIFHSHGLFVASNVTLMAGGAMIFLPRFDLDQVIALMPASTTMMGVPTLYTRLLDDVRFTPELTRHMRLFTSGSAPLLAETHIRFESRTGHRILERYGMTETNMNTSNPYDGERRAGTVGFALEGVELKITDAVTGASLPQGRIGQIEVRGPNVFPGYWQMPEKTREELREDGFFITGDLGRIDEQGYIHIVGRNKDMIISGGFNIYPKEIELLLDDQPGVSESAVIGVPHPDFGESVLAVLVTNGEQALNLGAIDQAVSDGLARFKAPKMIKVIDELPRNTMGKVQKNLLRDQFKDVFSGRI